jgi:hypothetical protein
MAIGASVSIHVPSLFALILLVLSREPFTAVALSLKEPVILPTRFFSSADGEVYLFGSDLCPDHARAVPQDEAAILEDQ